MDIDLSRVVFDSAMLYYGKFDLSDADKIIVMDNGNIVGIGTHEYLIKNNEIYREVYESQNKVGENDE